MYFCFRKTKFSSFCFVRKQADGLADQSPSCSAQVKTRDPQVGVIRALSAGSRFVTDIVRVLIEAAPGPEAARRGHLSPGTNRPRYKSTSGPCLSRRRTSTLRLCGCMKCGMFALLGTFAASEIRTRLHHMRYRMREVVAF